MSSSWSSPLVIREAVRNVFGLRSRLLLLVVSAAIAGSTCAAIAVIESQSLQRQVQTLEVSGVEVVAFGAASPREPVRITRSSCEALAAVPGVDRAGVLIAEGVRDLPELGARISVYSASTALFPGLRGADGLRGSGLSAAGPTVFATFGDDDVRGLVTAPAQPEGIPTNGGVVVPLSASVASAPTCIAVLDRFASTADRGTELATGLVASGGAVAAVPVLTPSSDPVDEWRARPGRYTGPALGLIGGLALSLLTWTRSSEVAAYRLSGTSRRDMAVILMIEALLVGGVFAVAGSAAAVLLHGAYVSLEEVLLTVLVGGACWVLGASVGVIRSSIVSAAVLARDR